MKMKNKGSFRSGTSGLVIPVPNKACFPKEFRDKSRLAYYGSLFNSIEINSSFYNVPMGRTVTKWAESVPQDFTFTFKIWKEITHVRGLVPNPEAIDHFMRVIDHAGDKKGCLLVQLPPGADISKRKELEQIIDVIGKSNKETNWKVALEFRHSSWYTDEIFAFADQYGASVVLHDMPASLNTRLNKKASFAYLRFHGKKGDYKGGYTDEELRDHSNKVKTWIEEGKDVYTYFNNTIGDAITNLMTLNRMVTSSPNV